METVFAENELTVKQDIHNSIIDAMNKFMDVSRLANIGVSAKDYEVEYLDAPHCPPARLPKGKMAVYMFFYQDQCLKVGKVGPNSNARYVSQHYHLNSSNSNLAKSLLNKSSELNLSGVNKINASKWIQQNTSRINILMDARLDYPALNLLEVYMQCRFKPLFEG